MDSQAVVSRLKGQLSRQLLDFAGKASPPANVFAPYELESQTIRGLLDLLDSGQAHVHDLGRAYRHSPKSAPALLFKYLVNRINHLDDYDVLEKGNDLDSQFLTEHVPDNKISLHHLYNWLSKNPHLLDETLAFKKNLAAMVERGIGLNVKMINSEPHVALTQPSYNSYPNLDRLLESMADLPHSGYGDYQHQMWVPLKDLWYGYPAAPSYARGILGHGDEWLASNTGPRYKAGPEDIGHSWLTYLNPDALWTGKDAHEGELPSLIFDDTPIDSIAQSLPLEQLRILHLQKKMTADTYTDYLNQGGDLLFVANSPFVTRGIAHAIAVSQMENGDKDIPALQNPNLTPGDLVNIVTDPAFMPVPDFNQEKFSSWLGEIVKHPSFNGDVADKLMERITAMDAPRYAAVLAQKSPIPIKGIHRFFLAALGGGPDLGWSPEMAIASAFHSDEPDPKDVPMAFNNSDVTEQYLRALDHYYSQNPDEEADDVYSLMLTGARLSDTCVSEMVTDFRSGNSLANVTDMGELLRLIAEKNPYLTARSMIHLAEIEQGREGLLSREDVPDAVQLVLADKCETPDELGSLIARSDFTPAAADAILHRIFKWDAIVEGDDLEWLSRRIAVNSNIPEEILERHLDQEAKQLLAKLDSEQEVDCTSLTAIQKGIVEGLLWRKEHPEDSMLLPVPVGDQ